MPILVGEWQPDAKRRTFTHLRINFYPTAVVFYNPIGYG